MQFSKVLIANRGEIAVRLIKACTGLGLKSVAVYSDADANAPHVALADEAVNIGPPEARSSYLNIEKVIEATRLTGAQAIHPGYGFLAENADFARQCVAAGLTFVGPSPDIIAAMGDKIEAKRIAINAGVDCVPGYHGDDQTDDVLSQEAQRIGVPLLIKASAGGGGRGMRRVDDLADVLENLSLARQEAQAAFGDPKVLLERLIEAPRHIEVQILADRHSNVRHLFERDCSVQRNYQKVIEEAPAPNLNPQLRQHILDNAVKLATDIGYDSAGTIEFIVDAATEKAYFLEMNTRLQVEHPVTEMITGIDLAEWQLRVAGGEVLPLLQADIPCEGWAMEARVAAENPAEGYRPETGKISSYVEPQSPDLRIDSGVICGSDVTPYYDSMLAKVIAKGRDRSSAIRTLREGLSRYRIGGVGVNSGFLQDVLGLEDFQAGRHLTNCLNVGFPDGWTVPSITLLEAAQATLARHLCDETNGSRSPWSSLGSWRVGERSGRPGAAIYHIRSGDASLGEAKVMGRAGVYVVEHDGENILDARQARLDEGCLVYVDGNQRQSIGVSVAGACVTVHRDGDDPQIQVLLSNEVLLSAPGKTATGGNSVDAPTPGLVVEVLVSPGDPVEAGQPVAVIEAMKLLQQLNAPIDGTVEAVHVRPGDTINGGASLVTIDAADAE
jgi:acetyl-CoA carboxylase biotin carboxylase subunit